MYHGMFQSTIVLTSDTIVLHHAIYYTWMVLNEYVLLDVQKTMTLRPNNDTMIVP